MSQLEPGSSVILTSAPASLLNGLPEEDQRAIKSIVGHPVLLAGYTHGQAELEFFDADGDAHTIWVETTLLRAA